MSFSSASSPSASGRHRLGLALAALVSLIGSGCFNDPKLDPTQTHHCKDDKSCPWGSVCAANGICCESTDGKTCKVVSPPAGLDALAIDSNMGAIDGTTATDGSSSKDAIDVANTGGAGGSEGGTAGGLDGSLDVPAPISDALIVRDTALALPDAPPWDVLLGPDTPIFADAATGPDLAIAPAALFIAPAAPDFGSILQGSSGATVVFTVTNKGGAASGAIATRIQGSNEFILVSDSCLQATLAPLATCSIGVQFSPISAGAKTGTLSVSANPGGALSAPLGGTGLAPGALVIAPAVFTFPDTAAGFSSPSQTFTVTNSGGVPVGTSTALATVLGGVNSQDFGIASNTCAATLAGGASCTVVMVFAPKTTGAKSATLNLTASPGGAASASLAGTAISGAILSITPDTGASNDFGSVLLNSSADERFVVINTGAQASSALSVTLTPAAGAAFTLLSPGTGDCVPGNTTLAGGASCSVRVRFAPTAGGTQTASLIASATVGGTTDPPINLTGKGKTLAALTLAPAANSSASFGSVYVGVEVDRTFVVTNQGEQDSSAISLSLTTSGNSAFNLVAPVGGDCVSGSTALAGGANCTVIVRFHCPATGSFAANLAAQATTGGSVPATQLTATGTNPPSGTIVEFPLPTGAIADLLTVGPDGNIWFTDGTTNQIGRITPAAVITEFGLPTANSNPNGITAGPDGNIWITIPTSGGNNKIGKMTLTGSVTEFAIPTVNVYPRDIVNGPDGNLWFAEYNVSKIARITTSGVLTEYSVTVGTPVSLVVGYDNAIWFVGGGSALGRLTTTGSFTSFTNPGSGAQMMALAAGPDHNIWLTDYSPKKIGYSTLTGTFTEWGTPSSGTPLVITAGPDGNMWFYEYGVNKLVRLTIATSSMTEFPIPSDAGNVASIIAGPDGNIWFSEPKAKKIAHITP